MTSLRAGIHLSGRTDKHAIVVTGSRGFVASHLITSLGADRVIGITRRPSNTDRFRQMTLEQLLERDFLRPAPRCIVHLASVTPWSRLREGTDFSENVSYAEILLRVMERFEIQRLIFASTGGVYGYHNSAILEETEVMPIDDYAKSKLAVEDLFEERLKPDQLVILRLFFPYGERSTAGLLPNLINRIRNSLAIRLNDEVGRPKINPIYIADVSKILGYFIESRAYGVFNVAGPDVVSIKELATLIGELCGMQPSFDVADSCIRHLIAETTKMKKLVRLRLTGIREGLQRMLL